MWYNCIPIEWQKKFPSEEYGTATVTLSKVFGWCPVRSWPVHEISWLISLVPAGKRRGSTVIRPQSLSFKFLQFIIHSHLKIRRILHIYVCIYHGCTYLSTYLPTYPFTYTLITYYLPTYLPAYLSNYQSIYPSIRHFFLPSIWPSILLIFLTYYMVKVVMKTINYS